MTTATKAPVSAKQRLEECFETIALLESAEHVEQSIVDQLVSVFAPHLDTERRAELWDEYTAALGLRSDVIAGIKDWTHVDPMLVGMDKTSAAIDICTERAGEALHMLTGFSS